MSRVYGFYQYKIKQNFTRWNFRMEMKKKVSETKALGFVSHPEVREHRERPGLTVYRGSSSQIASVRVTCPSYG